MLSSSSPIFALYNHTVLLLAKLELVQQPFRSWQNKKKPCEEELKDLNLQSLLNCSVDLSKILCGSCFE
jgi:hypothetical protein